MSAPVDGFMTNNSRNCSSSARVQVSPVSWRTALERVVAGVRHAYGPRIHRLVLYGSRARGDAHPDSDVDVLVVLDTCDDLWGEQRRLSQISREASEGAETIVSAMPMGRTEFEQRQTPLLLNIRREGTDIPLTTV
jgi:predicted nucleotidyltransferase